MNILGISANFHDAACCALKDGVLVAAAQEERFTRRKHDPSIPKFAFRYCLDQAGLTIADIDCVAYYEDPTKKLARQIWMAGPQILQNEMLLLRLDSRQVEQGIRTVLGYEGDIEFVDHHQAHIASSFYYSGFRESATFTIDGVGEWATTTYGHGHDGDIDIFEEVHFPHSLGLLYSTVTGYLGFEVNDGEYKVMGLAPYGAPRYQDQIERLLESAEGGGYTLNLKYFDFLRPDRMYSDELPTLLGEPPRQPESEIRQFHKDVAKSLQAFLERVLLEKVKYLHQRVPSENLCLAGGVALNCVANSRILREGPFKRLFIQPAAGDAGGALGAAAIAHRRRTGRRMRSSKLDDCFLGPEYSHQEIGSLLQSAGVCARDYRGNERDLIDAVVDRLAQGAVVGWFHGRMEFGPRALGARSIIADPRGPHMRDRINALVKQRESFRPFAPAVLESRAADHFELDHPSPFMLETCQVKSPLDLPAITHVDGSARIQTVSPRSNPRFAMLLEAFERRTGCPILLNTSFNMRGEPIVCDPVDALVCFVRSQLDTLVLDDFLIDNSAVSPEYRHLIVRYMKPSRSAIGNSVYTLF
jgi:carbamoyltransferase